MSIRGFYLDAFEHFQFNIPIHKHMVELMVEDKNLKNEFDDIDIGICFYCVEVAYRSFSTNSYSRPL